MKVLVVDDQRVVREGLATIIGTVPGFEVVGQAADGAAAVGMVRRHGPDVVLMDLRMPGLDGVAATAAIRRDHPGTQVVVLTTFAEDDSIIAALSAGAVGFLTKDASREDIRRAIEAAAAGQSVLDPVAQAALLNAASRPAAAPAAAPTVTLPDGLTEREGEVLVLIAEGLSNQEIAGRLYVSEATVKTHINHIFAKTHSRDRTAAAAYAHRHRLVQ
ncbi:MAG TPA: response regulator transcription factor [Acidimicrobiales bacterium]|jgi:DNA-binding NarL/FixJ family response regulator|nr:response regulator transcription factor [Acidimicrobiales bacterium]